jgi:hypothetical protein
VPPRAGDVAGWDTNAYGTVALLDAAAHLLMRAWPALIVSPLIALASISLGYMQ